MKVGSVGRDARSSLGRWNDCVTLTVSLLGGHIDGVSVARTEAALI